ncbi:MAG: hypothetical protein WAK55_22045 [Xanthobacteraceae bacterium]
MAVKYGTWKGDREGYKRGAAPLSKSDIEFMQSEDSKRDYKLLYPGAQIAIAAKPKVLGK